MRKKINFKVPKLIIETLEEDRKYYEISREKLCNLVFEKFAFKEIRNNSINYMEQSSRMQLTFNLNKKNEIYYTEVMCKNKVEVEADYLRMLFALYINLHPSIREKIIYDYTYERVENSIKRKSILKINHKNNLCTIKPLKIVKDENNYNAVVTANDKFLLSKIEILQ